MKKIGLMIGIGFIIMGFLYVDAIAKPILYFDFSEGKGNVVSDLSGNNNNGKLIGGVEWVKGKKGYVVRFNGISGYIEVPASPNLNLKLADKFSVEVWVKPDATQKTTYPNIMFVKGTRGTVALQMHISNKFPFPVAVNRIIKGELCQVCTPNLLQPGVWTHIVFTCDGSVEKIYLNGKLTSQRKYSGCTMPSLEPITIGAGSYGTRGYKGLIGMIRIYDEPLGKETVENVFNETSRNYLSKEERVNFERKVSPWNWYKDEKIEVRNSVKTIDHTYNLFPGGDYQFTLCYKTPLQETGSQFFVKIAFNDVEDNELEKLFKWDLPASVEWITFKKELQIPEEAAETFIEIGAQKGKLVCNELELKKLPSKENWHAEWIWYPESFEIDNVDRYFRKVFTITDKIKDAWIHIAVDDKYLLYINGEFLGEGSGWVNPRIYEVSSKLKQGKNVIAIKASDFDEGQGVLFEMIINYDSGEKVRLISDESWKCYDKEETNWQTLEFNDSGWRDAISLGAVPTRPWGSIPYTCKKKISLKETPPLNETLNKIKKEKEIIASIKKYKGLPTLFINKELRFPMIGKGAAWDETRVLECANSDIHLYIPNWAYVYSRGECNFSSFDNFAYITLSNDPDAYIMVMVLLDSDDFWDRLHPDQLCTFADGTKKRQSFSSQIWRQEFGIALGKLVEHINNSPYANRVIGYFILAGEGFEWIYWGVYGGEKKFPDYSKCAVSRFREWLRRKYNNNLSLFRSKWHDNKIEFDNVSIPTKEERIRKDFFVFRNPQKSQNVIDYYTFHSENMADSIIHFAKIVKQKTKNRAICGTFYGEFMEHSGLGYIFLNGGHLALRKVLDSPYIDFVASPISYRFREVGGSGPYMIPKNSVYLHNKMLFHEADIRTYLSSLDAGYGRTNNLKDTISVLKREYLKMLTEGIGLWWNLDKSWFISKPIFNFFSQAEKIGKESLNKRKLTPSEIAMIVDERSPIYMSLEPSELKNLGKNLNNELISMQRGPLHRIGAPFDTYLLSDVLDYDIPDYKLYIFLNPFYLTERERKIIKNKFEKDGHFLLWVYAPGFIDEDGFSIKNSSELTGIRLNYEAKEAPLTVNVLKDKFRDKIGTNSYGMKGEVGPVFYIDDPEVEVLGRLKCNNKIGLGIKRFKDWTSIYSSTPPLPDELLRVFAKMAGVHIYIDSGDVIFVNENYLGIHTSTSGEKLIKLRNKCSPYELFKHKYFGRNIKEFSFKAKKNITYIFELRREWND